MQYLKIWKTGYVNNKLVIQIITGIIKLLLLSASGFHFQRPYYIQFIDTPLFKTLKYKELLCALEVPQTLLNTICIYFRASFDI